MPGHACAALSAYPELSCTGGPYTPNTKGGVFAGVYCAGKDETFEFLQNVLAEVRQLFPGQVHPHRRRRGAQGQLEEVRPLPGPHASRKA